MTTITAVKPQLLNGLSYIKINLDDNGKIGQAQNHTACWDMVVEQSVEITMPVYTKQANVSRVYRDVVTVKRNNRRSDIAELTPEATNELVRMVRDNKRHAIERDPLNAGVVIIRVLED